MSQKNEPVIHDVFCIIVTYHPNLELFEEVLNSIIAQSTKLVVVDNSGSDNELVFGQKASHFLNMHGNAGIGAAQNAGIRLALQNGAKYVWLSDQDTIYPTDFLVKMLAFIADCERHGIAVGAAVPAYSDTHRGAIQPFLNYKAVYDRYIKPVPGINLISHAIASGTLISKGTLEHVGLMQEDLFIDWVDLEWCWRATNKFGYQNVGTGDVVIHHTMGDGYVTFFNRQITIRSPIRHYYFVRNAVHLALYSDSANAAVRRFALFSAVMWAVIFPLVAPNEKLRHLRATVTGLFDGLRNRLGKKVL